MRDLQVFQHNCVGTTKTAVTNSRTTERVFFDLGETTHVFESTSEFKSWFDGLSNIFAAWHADTFPEPESTHVV